MSVLSCTRTTHLINHQEDSKTFNEFNYLGKQRNAYIELENKNLIRAKSFELENDTVIYITQTDSVKYLNTKQIRSIYFKDHFVGTFDGMFFGFLSGLTTGALFINPDVEMAHISVLLVGLGGSAIGAVGGSIKGSKLKYKFKD